MNNKKSYEHPSLTDCLFIKKASDDAGAFIKKRQRLAVADPPEFGPGIAFGLLFDFRDLVAKGFFLGLDDADSLFVDMENVVSGADIGLVFAHRDSRVSAELDLLVYAAPHAEWCRWRNYNIAIPGTGIWCE